MPFDASPHVRIFSCGLSDGPGALPITLVMLMFLICKSGRSATSLAGPKQILTSRAVQCDDDMRRRVELP